MDKVLARFLERQCEAAMRFAAESDLLDVEALDTPAQHYLARFHCRGLVRAADGSIIEAEGFDVGIWLSDDYLMEIEPLRIATWLGPPNVFHPQIRPPFMCLGHLMLGTPLVEILTQIWSVITYRKVTVREDDALNPAACAWARHNLHRFPIDKRLLKRRAFDVKVDPLEAKP